MSKAHQKRINALLSESDEESKHSSDQEEDEPLNTSFDSAGSKRGRPAIPLSWTRVFRVKDNHV